MTRKVCVITGSRAEYGLLRWVMQGIKDDPELTLQVIATGMHLSSVFGMTYREIEQDGFYIDASVEILLSEDTPLGIAESMASGISGCAKAFDQCTSPEKIMMRELSRQLLQPLHGGFPDDDALAFLLDAEQSGQALFVL